MASNACPWFVAVPTIVATSVVLKTSGCSVLLIVGCAGCSVLLNVGCAGCTVLLNVDCVGQGT